MSELIFVGLGLAGPRDMSLKALDVLRTADRVFGEFYTSMMVGSGRQELELAIGRGVDVLDRGGVEEGGEVIEAARRGVVAFVTAGDPMSATTHVDLRLRAEREGIPTRLVHGVSIFTAAPAAFGLQPYKFGRAVTIPFPEPGFLPSSPYEKILENRSRGLHTLVLLDIKEDLGRYMSAAEGAKWLMDAEARIGGGLMTDGTVLCAGARIGSSTEKLMAAAPSEVASADLGGPLHCLIVPGDLHFMEADALVALASASRSLVGSSWPGDQQRDP